MDYQLCKAGSQLAVTVKNRYQDILPLIDHDFSLLLYRN